LSSVRCRKNIERKLHDEPDRAQVTHRQPALSIRLKIRQPDRTAFSLISFEYQPNVDHPVRIAQELVAENYVHGHDYILIAANIDKIVINRATIRFTLHKIDGKGSNCSVCQCL
jgi:hypothetical protein